MTTRQSPEWVFFTPDLDGGGSQKVLVTLVNGLVRRGNRVEIVAMRAGGVLRPTLDPRAVVTDLACGYATLLPRLIRYFRGRQPAFIIGFYNAFTLFPLTAQKLSRLPIRVVPTIHVSITGILRESPNFVLRWAYRLVLLWWRRVPRLIAVSEGIAKDLESHGVSQDRIRVVYNPILTMDFFNRTRETTVDPSIQTIGPDVPIILAVGRLDHQKNFSAILEAHAAIRKDRPVKLVLLGDGPEHRLLQALAQRLGTALDVHFLGYVANPIPYMRRAGALVLSSRYEGLPIVAIEALAVGTPVVAYSGLGLEEIRDTRLIHLVPPNNAAELSIALEKVLSAPRPDQVALAELAAQFGEEASLNAYHAAVSI